MGDGLPRTRRTLRAGFQGPRPRKRFFGGLVSLFFLLASGCNGMGPIARWRAATDPGIANGLTDAEKGDPGFLGRFMPNRLKPPPPFTGPDPLVLDPKGWQKAGMPEANPTAAKEVNDAITLFQKGDYAAAEEAFTPSVKKWKDTPWGERAQYWLAETQFQRGRYFYANDNFVKLLADYPGSEFKEKAVRREFEIGNIWLAAEDPKSPPEAREKFPDRFNGRLPLLDVSGYAIRVFEHVQQHDATGPLVDDAAMRVADYNYGLGRWELAAVHYDEVYKNYPKSPFAEKALFNSIDAKVKSYLGPAYDYTMLDEARNEVKLAMEQFPNRDPSTNEKLYKTLDLVRAQEAERTFQIGAHYLHTKHVAAAEFYFGEIPIKWPKSPYAARAKDQLAKIAKMPRKESQASKIMTRPGSADPFSSGMTSGNMSSGMPGMGSLPGNGP